MGRVKSREMGSSWVPTPWDERKATPAAPLGEEQSDPARSKTPSTPRSFLARESGDPCCDRLRWTGGPRRESCGSATAMNAAGKSDWPIVPQKSANKAGGAPPVAESVEGRGQAKGKSGQSCNHRAQYRRVAVTRAGPVTAECGRETGKSARPSVLVAFPSRARLFASTPEARAGCVMW
jgi:hypothetical protein